MNAKFWFIIGWAMMINLASSSSSSSWFRMKFLVGSYETYYDYRIQKVEENDSDICPDIYKSAVIYAITGRYLYKVKQTCSSFYTVKQLGTETPPTPPPTPTPTPPPTPGEVDMMMRDFLITIFQLAHSTIKHMMFMMFVFLAICSNLLLLILVYFQF